MNQKPEAIGQEIQLKSWHTITVCGMKGTGKTNLEKFVLSMFPRVLVFDTNGEFPEFNTYEPSTDSPKELDAVAKQVWKEGNCFLVVSEAELFLPVNGTLPPNIFKIITRGRHRNIGLLADTRRVANLNKTVFGLSEHVFVFRHFSPNDIRYLQNFIPQDCRALANIQDYHFWYYHKGQVVEHEPVKNMVMPKKKSAKKSETSKA